MGHGEAELLGEEPALGLSFMQILSFPFLFQDLISTRGVATLRRIILRRLQMTALKRDFF